MLARRLLIMLAVVLAAIAAGFVFLAWDFIKPAPRTDPAALATWKRVVGPALDDLNALPRLKRMKNPGPAEVHGCSVDSGETFGIWAGRWWDGKDGYSEADHPSITSANIQNFELVVRDLQSAGWRVDKSERQMDPDAPTVENGREAHLSRLIRGTRVDADVAADEGASFSVMLRFPGAPAGCSGASRG